MIEVKNVTKYYGKRLALDDISFSVGKGEIVGFLGPNGAGKTTTMRIMTGFLAPTSGDVKIAGYDVLTNSLEARRHIGYLPESVPLYTDMTVGGYLGFLARLRQLPKDRIKLRINEVVTLCHLEEYADVIIGKLSKGFRQRVGIAQAILHEPEVLILDEPTIGIDPIQVSSTRQIIRDLGRERTVILSTHILPEVSMTCQRVIIINEGRILAEDRIENLSALISGSKRVWLEVEGPTDRIAQHLRQIKGVTRVSYQDSRFSIEYPAGQDLRARIIESIAQGGFTLLSLESEALSLEDIFLKLTTEEAGG
ncbi:MAG: ATP-binding cassette domain-containing protein [Chloroflexi bacterium]|nr:ATP-binding cassette domain-containing protein [Chloroflexota bacterium]